MTRSRTNRRLQAMAATSIVVMGLAACGSDGGGSGSDSDEPIKIGTSLPLTGEFSQPGTAAQQGYQVWEQMVNDSGGMLGRDVELIIKDDASNQNTIVADYNALISQDDEAVAEQVDDVFRLPETDPLIFSVLAILPGQLMPYWGAVANGGINPDTQRANIPRHAKVWNWLFPKDTH